MLNGKAGAIIGLVSLIVLALLINSGIVPYYLEEPRRVIIAFEMMRNGNLIIPTELGELYFKKPPVFNWILILYYKVFGQETEFISRLAASSVFVIWPIWQFKLLKNWIGKNEALIASVLLFASAELLFYFSLLAEVDIFYSMLSAMAILGFLKHIEKEPSHAFLYLYGLNAIGLLTKGLPSLLFIGISLVAYLVFTKKIKFIFTSHHVIGILVFTLITFLYFGAYSVYENPYQFILDFWEQSEKRTVLHKKDLSIFTHLLVFPVWFWLAMAPGSLILLILPFNKKLRTSWWQIPTVRLLLFMLLAQFSVYWISPGSSMRYVYMLFPFLLVPCAILLAKADVFQEKLLNRFQIGFLVFSILILFGVATAPFIFDSLTKGQVLLAYSLALVSCGIGFVVYKKLSKVWVFLLSMIILRISFNLLVLPIRAQDGAVKENFDNAHVILNMTEGSELAIWHKLTTKFFSLSTAHYIEKGRDEILRFTDQQEEGSYLITETKFLDDHPEGVIIYRFKNAGVSFLLLEL